MKFNFKAVLISAVLAFSTIPAYAATQIYGDVGITSDYVYRGITQTNENAAFQGSLGLQLDSGLYVEGFASQVELAGNDTEIDATAGYRLSGDTLQFDVGATRFTYKGGEDIDRTEVFAEVTGDISVVAVSASVNHDIDTDVNYYNVKGRFTPFWDLSAIASYGILDTDNGNVNDWYLAVGKKFYGLNVEAGYYANDADFELAKITDNKVAVKVAYSF